MKAVVAAFNQEKALVGAFSVIKNLRMEIFEALAWTQLTARMMAGTTVSTEREKQRGRLGLSAAHSAVRLSSGSRPPQMALILPPVCEGLPSLAPGHP